MRILVCNDDGIYSPGIRALARCASRFGDVRIVAPDVERSSAGHAISASRPLTYRDTPIDDFEAYRVDGTPADCVALGVFKWRDVDVVLSGINLGLNIGNGLWHSGTLAAAKQAALLGVRGIAVSTPTLGTVPDFDHIAPSVEETLELLLPRSDLRLVNVNIPPDPIGVRWTRQSVRTYDGRIVPAQDPRGRQIYWFTVEPIEAVEEGTDRWAVQNACVSMTPLRLDLTDEAQLDRLLNEHGARHASAVPRAEGA